MSQLASCPECHAKLKLQNALRGKKIRCPRCKQTFVADGVEARQEEPPVLEPVDEVKPERLPEVEDDIQPEPRRRPVAARDDERGASRRRPPAFAGDADDSDFRSEDGDRSPNRETRRAAKKSKAPILLLVAGLAFVFVLLVGGVAGSVVWWALARIPKEVASAESLGKNANDKERGGNPQPEPEKPDRQPPGEPPPPVGAFSVKDVPLELGAFSSLLPCMCWAQDGRSFFCLDETGWITEMAADGSKKLNRADLGEKCSWLSPSGAGLLVTLPDKQEIALVDPKTLKFTKRMPVASAFRGVSASGLSYAFAVGKPNPAGDSLYVVDLKTGEMAREYTNRDFPGKFVGFARPAVTPDGKHLFAMGGIEQLHRYRIDGPTLTYEESSPRIAQGRTENIQISPDSAYVCLPSGGGNYDAGNSYSTFIYSVDNITKAALTINQGAYPLCVGFEPRGGAIFSQNHDKQLLVFNKTGIKLKEYNVGQGEVRQYLVHPQGQRLIILVDKKLYYVEVPRM
jgi:predicted Zn finger-like uncharacterized protein